MRLEGWNFQAHSLISGERRGAGDEVQSPVASDLVSRAYVTKLP